MTDIEPVDSRIVAATVFSDVALVVRRAEVSVGRGPVRLVFSGLPQMLDPSRVRVSATRGTVLAVEMDEIDREPSVTSDAVALRLSAEALSMKLQRLDGELDGLRSELAIIDELTPIPATTRGGTTTSSPLRPSNFMAGLDLLTKRRAGTLVEARRLEAEQDEARRELVEIERRRRLIGEMEGEGRRVSVLAVSIESPSEGAEWLEILYEAGWATWRPYYHLRVNAKDDSIECVRFADLWQETGEDWIDVRLRLSTAEPEVGLTLPTVLPWTLGLAKTYEDRVDDLYRAHNKRRARTVDGERPKRIVSGNAGASFPLPQEVSAAPMSGPEPAPPFDDRLTPRVVLNPMPDELAAPEDSETPRRQEASLPRQAVLKAQLLEEAPVGVERLDHERGLIPSASFGAVEMKRIVGPHDPEAQGEAADRDDFRTDDGFDAFDKSEMYETLETLPPLARPKPSARGHRALGPSPDHPDRARLSASRPPHETSGGIDFEVEADSMARCLSGTERRRISLGSTVYPVKIDYLLRPAVKDHAFARAVVTNSEGQPLLGGPAAVFVDDAFFGETELKTTPTGGKLVLDLGAETRIKSARRTKTTVSTEGIFTKGDVHLVEIVVEIESFVDRPVDIEVEDQVPLSADPNVKVKPPKTEPKHAAFDELTGIVTFHVRLAPKSRAELRLSYEIEAPKDYRLRQILGG